MIGGKLGKEVRSLWHEFEEKKTNEEKKNADKKIPKRDYKEKVK